MTLNVDSLAQRLTGELGADAVSMDVASLNLHCVDGKTAALICRPSSAAEVAAALRLCSEAQAHVTPWGGGTAMLVGNLPRRVDVVVDLSKLNRVMDHDAANLTVTVQSGMSLSALQAALAPHRQFAPFDAPWPERATVGGTIATNLNGPRRSACGSVRDLVIGMKIALAGGEQIKGGGKVVKNVAGYDLCKLFVGSLGTLGIITEATVRVAPMAESAATVAASGNLASLLALIEAIGRSALLPAALALIYEPMTSQWRAAIRCEGFEATVARCRTELAALGERFGVPTEVLAAPAHDDLWKRAENFPLSANRLIFRVTLPIATLAGFIQAIEPLDATAVCADVAAGTLWLGYEPRKSSVEYLLKLQELARAQHGHAVLFAAPASMKQGVDVWGPIPTTFPLMRDLKRQFDPQGLLNPGRFVGGL